MTPELQILLDEIGRLRTDVTARLDLVVSALGAKVDRDEHDQLDAKVSELETTVSRWKGAAGALAAGWAAITTGAGVWFASKGGAP